MNFQLTPFNRNIILAAVIVVIAFIAYFSTYQPKNNELTADRAHLAQLTQNYDDLKRVADQKPEYLALEHQIQSRLSGVELTVDSRAYIPSYLKQVEALAIHDGLTVTAVVPQPLPTPTGGATAAPAAAAGGPQAVGNAIPAIGAAARVAGASNAEGQQINATAAQTGEPGPQGQTQNGTPAPTTVGGATGTGVASTTLAAGSKPGPTATPSARQNAIVFVNQSFQVVPVNMELSGTYADLQTFLRDLTKFPKLIEVGDVTLTPSLQAVVGETPSLHIVLPIKAYRLTAGQPVVPQTNAAPAPGNGG
jgi:Tfp pilus assembly protein PilO